MKLVIFEDFLIFGWSSNNRKRHFGNKIRGEIVLNFVLHVFNKFSVMILQVSEVRRRGIEHSSLDG